MDGSFTKSQMIRADEKSPSEYLIRESTQAEAGDCLDRRHTGHVADWIPRPFLILL